MSENKFSINEIEHAFMHSAASLAAEAVKITGDFSCGLYITDLSALLLSRVIHSLESKSNSEKLKSQKESIMDLFKED